MNPFRTRLRQRILLVALIAATPAIAAIVVTQSTARQRERDRTLADSLRLVRLAASQQASVFNGARLLLLTLAEFSPVRGGDPGECLDLLPRILSAYPGYLALTVANADGSIFCSTSPRERLVLADARGRKWFERAMRTRTTAIGDYQFSAVTGAPAIVVAQPLFDADGEVSRIVVAMIDLAYLNTIMSGTDLPAGGTLTLFDRSGTILARFPDRGSWINHRVPEAGAGALEQLVAGAAEVRSDGVGVDGIRRLYVTVPVSASVETRLYMGMGIDHDTAFRESDRNYRAYLWLLGLVSLVGVGAAAIGSHLFVLRPMKSLKAVTERIASGDLSARAQLASSIAGISELGDAVNAMADALDTRQRGREDAERELRDSEDRYRLLFAQNPQSMWVYDAETLAFLEVNDAAVQQYGYSRSEFLAMRITDIRPASDLPKLMATLGPARTILERSSGWRHRLKSGELIDVEIASHTMQFAGRPAIVVTAQDITVRTRAEAALAERAALTTASAEVGAALNRQGELRGELQSCGEAIVAHLDLTAVRIWLNDLAGGGPNVAATAGDGLGDDASERLKAGEWPLAVGNRVVGRLEVFARTRLSEGVVAGLTSIAAMIALGATRHQAEDARRLLASIVASSDEAIYGTRTDGTVVSWNAGAERLFGYRSEEIVGRPISLLYPPDRSGELPDLMVRINRGEHVMHFETVRQRQDGSMVPVSLSLSPIKDAAGAVLGTSAIARDITERLRVEGALRDAEERMRFALETSQVGVWEANIKAGTGFWSSTCEAMHGLAPGTFGRTYEAFIDHVHPDDRADTRQQVARALQQRAPAEMEYRTVWPDGTVRRISLIAHFSFNERGAPVRAAGVTIDVTERRSLEDQLRQSQKMDAIGQLAGGIAHDFNNLLTVIQGCAGFLAEELPDSDARHTDVEDIQRAAERAAGLTRQLLAFSRKQILAVRVLHAGDIVGEVTPMLRRLIGETIDLRTAVANRGLVKADPGQLQQVIVNLAVNARDAMPQGGRLTLETSDVVLDAAFARLHPSVRPGPHVMLTISDTGHGMDAATQKRIFEPFFTTKPLGQGTGLGLATVYGIVKQSGGTIWVDSEVGRGTTFSMYLPRTDDVEGVDAPVTIETRASGGSETVLLIEDESPVREFVYKVLSRRGYAVHAVANPLKALDYAQAQRAPIDLVLSDVILPNMSGRAVVTQIQQCHPESEALYMSGYTDQAIVQEGVLDAGTAFLQKPFTADALTRKVRDVLDARTSTHRITATGAGDRSSGTASGG